MAPTHSSFTTLLLLLSLLVIASAASYGDDKKPETTKPKYSYDPKPQPDLPKPNYNSNPKPDLPRPKLTVPKQAYGYGSKPYPGKPTIPKPDTVRPNYGYDPKPDVPKPKLTVPKPKYSYDPKPKLKVPKPKYSYDPKPKLIVPKPDSTGKPDYEHVHKPELTVPKPDHVYVPREKVYNQPKPEITKPQYGYTKKPNPPKPKFYIPKPSNENEYSPIGVEGLVLCKQGSNYTPLEGAVIRVACTAMDQHGYRKVHFSCLTGATDAKGYYFKTLPSSGLDDHLKITECKAYLESSPLKTCNVPTNMNDGISGAPLSAYRILHDKKMKLYSMRTFFYTSTKPPSTPAAGY
ncbi:proline-rich protein [Salix suchowensis]|nr:proline-rich protein [Salix suchowensis]